MPFDFRMKHEGEPPARLVAQLRLRLKEDGQPPRMADFIAPVMESADDLDDDMLIQIDHLVRELEREKVTREEADAAIREVVSALIAEAAEREATEEEQDEDITAWYPKKREARSQPVNLARRVVMRVRHNRNPNPVRTRNHAPRVDRFGNTMVNGGHPAVRAMADHLAGRRPPNQPVPSLSEIAMYCARRSGQRPFNTAEGARMAMHSSSDFPRILEGAIGNAVARRMEQTVPGLLRASHLIQASTYHQGSLLALSASGIPQEINETGEIKHVTIDETGELKPVPRDFGSMFRLSQKTIVNDEMGLLEQATEKMVWGANERLRRVLLEPLLANGGAGHVMSDGKPVFHADHGLAVHGPHRPAFAAWPAGRTLRFRAVGTGRSAPAGNRRATDRRRDHRPQRARGQPVLGHAGSDRGSRPDQPDRVVSDRGPVEA